MKSILLASASILAFSGAAYADGHVGFSFSGEATLGYNDDDLPTVSDDENGFYWDLEVDVSATMELDNGLTAAASFGFEAVDDDGTGDVGQDLIAKDYVLSVSNDMAGLFFGKTAFAAETHWASAGDMEADPFSENDGETTLRGDVSFGGVDASVSYHIHDEDPDAGDQLEQLSIGVSGSFSAVNFSVAYQEETDVPGASGDFSQNEIIGISAGTSFGGADITVAYAMWTARTAAEEAATGDLTSTGIKIAYPLGPVTVTAYYVMEDAEVGDPDDNFGVEVAYVSGPISATLDYQDDQGTTKVALDASYDVGNGLTVLAGYYTEDAPSPATDPDDEFYIAATYDLGGGAELLVAFAEGDDEVGDPEYENGTTVEVSFDF